MKFDSRYIAAVSPPAPMVVVRVRHPAGGRGRRLPALLDTGADRTVVPVAVVQRLGVAEVRRLMVAGFDGVVAEWPVYRVRLQVHRLPSTLVDVVAGPGEECLLGRDVLNLYTITLDGPAGLLTITDD